MTRLILGGEELELELRQEGTENAGFTVSAFRWEQPEGAENGAGAQMAENGAGRANG